MSRGRAGHIRVKRARPRTDRGASAVEFALLLPLLVILVFGMIGFGLSLWTQISAAGGIREAARLAAVVPSCSTWLSRVDLAVTYPAYFNLKREVLDKTEDGGNGNGRLDVGERVRVSFEYEANEAINTSLAIATGLFGGGIQLPETYTAVEVTRAEYSNNEGLECVG